MSVDIGVDVEVLKREIKKMYASVSQEPDKDFIFPTGRAWAEDLGYPEELGLVPDGAVESFEGSPTTGRLGGCRLVNECSTSAAVPARTR